MRTPKNESTIWILSHVSELVRRIREADADALLAALDQLYELEECYEDAGDRHAARLCERVCAQLTEVIRDVEGQ